MSSTPITLSELNRLISQAVAERPELRDVWVVAELSNVSGGKGTHWYMDLLEKDASGNNLARIKGMMWAQHSRRINMKLYTATGVYFRDGIKVMIRGQVSFHPNYGMGFTVTDVEPSYTIGDMERIRREILNTLAKEGILDRNRSLPIPITPQRIAVISAEGAAGYGDFVHQLGSTPEGFIFETRLFPARLQGEQTASSVIAALDRIERNPEAWDAIVIIRGGGAASDLNGFDNLELTRRVALSPLPVIVGIGHERDRTVLDEIAAVRCKTPTAVAAWLIDTLRSALGRATELTETVARLARDRLTGDARRLDNSALRIPSAAGQAITNGRLTLEKIQGNLKNSSDSRISSERHRLSSKADSLRLILPTVITRGCERIESLERLVKTLDPKATLRRGYSITKVNGRALHSALEMKPGTILETILPDGTLRSQTIEDVQ